MIYSIGNPAWFRPLLAFALLYPVLQTALANDPPQACRIDDTRFVCASGTRNQEVVFDAMALPESEKMLIEKLNALPVFSSKLAREEFRISLESNWRSVLRYARRQTRLYRRGRLDESAYRRVQEKFQQAEKTYRAAIELYRNHIWQPPGRDS